MPTPPDTRRSARFITHSPPSPGISGDRIRAFHLMRALKTRGWTIRLLSLVGRDEPAGSVDAIRAIADEVVLVPREGSGARRRLRLARDLMTGRALQQDWFWSPASAHTAIDWLADVEDEAIFVEQLYMYPFVPPRLRARVALDSQNHETARIRAMANGGGSLTRRLVSRLQVRPVEAYERAALGAVGRILAVSRQEVEAFETMAPGRVRLIPNGVDAKGIAPRSEPSASGELLFLGSLGYSANVDAVRYFATDIAPKLVGSGATWSVVGSNPGRAVRAAAVGAPLPVTFTGYAPDVGPYYKRCRAMIVPLRHGAGTRLKILEALAWGLPVVTTSVGGAGLDLVDGRHVLIADDPTSFAAAVERLLRDDDLWRDLSRAGRAFVEERYDWEGVATAFAAAMCEVADATEADDR